jgi:hypothetical protein
MATDTFHQLVSDMIMETGINGGVAPASVETATDDAAKVVYWIRIADLQLQRERIDFNFLWGIENAELSPGSAVVPSPVDTATVIDSALTAAARRTVLVNAMPKDRLAIIDANGQAYFPEYKDWNEFSIMYNYETQLENDFPTYWSARPDKVILLSNPVASSSLVCKYEYWRKPIRMRVNDDVTRVPDDFNRLIILLAKILYAEHEDAPEVDIGSSAHYDSMLNQMIAVETPMAEWQRLENSDRYLQVETR